MQKLDETIAWYAVRVRSRHEGIVATALTQKGYDVLLPQYRCRKRWSDRIKEVTLPLFPGYLFSRFDVRQRFPVLVTPDVLHIVSAGETFLPVEPHEIAAIQQIVASELPAEPWPYSRIGERVRIEAGPLRGIEGLVTGINNRRRLVVSITLLQRSVAVEIDPVHALPADADAQVLGYEAWQFAGASA